MLNISQKLSVRSLKTAVHGDTVHCKTVQRLVNIKCTCFSIVKDPRMFYLGHWYNVEITCLSKAIVQGTLHDKP